MILYCPLTHINIWNFADNVKKQNRMEWEVFSFSGLFSGTYVFCNISIYNVKAASKQEGPKKFGVPDKKAVLL